MSSPEQDLNMALAALRQLATTRPDLAIAGPESFWLIDGQGLPAPGNLVATIDPGPQEPAIPLTIEDLAFFVSVATVRTRLEVARKKLEPTEPEVA